MKYLIEWAFKLLVYVTFGAMAGLALIILTILMWDRRFMDLCNIMNGYIWKKR